ncbi:hypothetical protein DL767_007588 [Monosporascus sp. MG133]|nr:hypothetical protein DL767_007588 [Monosporascus sp. MG133]
MSFQTPTPAPAMDAPATVAPRTYHHVNDLTAAQKVALIDIWKAAERAVPGMEMSDAVISKFLTAIFADGWDTYDDSLMAPRLPDRKLEQTSVIAGKFKTDLPNKGNPQELEVRKAGRPAYLKVHVGGPAEALGWLWTDAQGRTANKGYIELIQDEGRLMKKAVLKYDWNETLRVLQYNTQVAIFIARHRILAWSTDGYRSPAKGEDNRWTLFKPLVLASVCCGNIDVWWI